MNPKPRITTRVFASALPLALLAGLAGCEIWANRGNTTLVTLHLPDNPPTLIEAPFEGHYVLFRGDARQPLARASLRQGERLGFQRDAVDTLGRPVAPPGRISAVAGVLAVPLTDDVPYEWRLIPDSDQATLKANPHMPRP